MNNQTDLKISHNSGNNWQISLNLQLDCHLTALLLGDESECMNLLSPAEVPVVTNKGTDLLERGFIEPSTSAWGSPMIV